jgi:hypothetical protein
MLSPGNSSLPQYLFMEDARGILILLFLCIPSIALTSHLALLPFLATVFWTWQRARPDLTQGPAALTTELCAQMLTCCHDLLVLLNLPGHNSSVIN